MDDEEEWIEGYEPPIGSIPEPLPDEHGPKRRVKRQQAEPYNFNGDKTRCPLLLVADYRFFREMGGSNYKTTVNYLVSFKKNVFQTYSTNLPVPSTNYPQPKFHFIV